MIDWGDGGRLDIEGWAAACFRSQENRPLDWVLCRGCGAIVRGVTERPKTCPVCTGATGAKGTDAEAVTQS